ncbi:uncharacterized protein PFL1_06899 [Pseudozyma flocculosa PF-1]|uniref:Serine/threonine-protein phosphatase n=1 Tax=Pseudozyma flocculosa PF-1 TaxID=1277687 RepID=A0A061H3N8_9BASI|nr:uncharacterized protein PFL1_06899 [Pseudozyma flocculosa PF-1]EPQ27153.1 hypothetical protein PFL1_06899 [Pseudozyma flocculosa PF-1]
MSDSQTSASPSASSSTAPSSPLTAASSISTADLDQSRADASLPVEERRKRAQALKDEGNRLFLSSSFEDAKVKYGESIALDPTVPAVYSNRAACELKLEQHGLAIEDATKAIQLDPKFSKAYYRRARGYLSILDPKSALPDLKMLRSLEPRNPDVKAQLEATVKLIRRLEFEKAIKAAEGVKPSQTVEDHLREGTGGCSLPDTYDGPRLSDGDDDATRHLGKIDAGFIDAMLEFFKKGGRLPLRVAWQIILGALRQMQREPPLVDYEVPVGQTIDVVGDTHGQFYDFLHLLSLTGRPSAHHAILFNGDFVDRGSWSVEIALTIFAYKWLYPATTLVNRGNHETNDMNKVYGFEGECKAKFGGDMTFKLFTEAFVALPLATLITAPSKPLQGDELPYRASLAQRSPILDHERGLKRFFVVHGGLFSKDGVTLDDIRAIDRFRIGQPGQEGLMMELLWSDPQAARGRGPSKRGVGLGFGPDITRAWCELNGVTAVLRSHEVRHGGYAEEHDGLCCTVFSAPNYCDSTGNKGAYARIDERGTIEWTTFEAQPHPDIKPMAYAGGAMGGMLRA